MRYGDERLGQKLERAIDSLYISEQRYEDARPHSERALALAEKWLGPDHPEVVKTLIDVGMVALYEGQYAQARAFDERALAIAERTVGPTHTNAVVPLHNLAEVLMEQGLLD